MMMANRWSTTTKTFLWAIAFVLQLSLLQSATSSSLGSGNWTLTSAPYGLSWDSISSDSTGQYLAATASYSGVYTSNDFGETWVPSLFNETFRWYPVVVGGTGQNMMALAVGHSAYRSMDYGSTWQAMPNLAPGNLIAITCGSKSLNCLAGRYGGSLYFTSDYGDTWEATSVPLGNWIALASNAAGTQFIASSDFNGVHISSDTGATWSLAPLVPQEVWISVASDATGENLAALARGEAPYISSDYGQVWRLVTELKTSISYYVALKFDGNGEQLVVVSNSVTSPVYITQDAGATWNILTPANSPSSLIWYGVTSDASGQYLAGITDKGGIYTYVLPIPTTCPPGKGREGFVCVACGCEEYNSGESSSCSSCANNAVSYPPYASCTQVCNYPYLVTVENADTCLLTGEVQYECQHVSLQSPLWLTILIIVFTGLCIFANLYTIHRKILIKLPRQSALLALGQLDGKNDRTNDSASSNSSTSMTFSRSQSSKAMAAAYDLSFYLRVAFRSGVPALDVMTDVLYIINSEFTNSTIFVLCILCFLHPIVFIGRDFWRLKDNQKALPHFYLLSIPNCIWNLFERVDDFFKLVLFALLSLPFVLVNAVTWFPMLVLMFLLYSNKMFAFTMYSKTWYACWNGSIMKKKSEIEAKETPEEKKARKNALRIVESATHDSMPVVDVVFFNEQSLFCVLLQSVPQFCLQLYNVYKLHKVTLIAILSLSMSMLAALNIFYRIVYYRLLLKMDMKDVPNVLLELNQIFLDNPSSEKKKKTKKHKKNNNQNGARDEEIQEEEDEDSDDESSEEIISPLSTSLSISSEYTNAHHQYPNNGYRGSFMDTIRNTFGYVNNSNMRPSHRPSQNIDMSVFAVTDQNGERILPSHPNYPRSMMTRPMTAEEEEKQTLLITEKVQASLQKQWAEEKEQWKTEILRTIRASTNNTPNTSENTNSRHIEEEQKLLVAEQVQLEVARQLRELGILSSKSAIDTTPSNV